jgi:hypothetical protein
MKRYITLLMIVALGTMLCGTCIAATKEKKLSEEQKKAVVMGSLSSVLQGARVSPLPQTVLSIDENNIKSQIFNSVEKMSSNGIKTTMWPFKVSGSGIVLASQQLGFMNVQQQYHVSVAFKVYAYFNETNDLTYETADVQILSNEKIGGN